MSDDYGIIIWKEHKEGFKYLIHKDTNIVIGKTFEEAGFYSYLMYNYRIHRPFFDTEEGAMRALENAVQTFSNNISYDVIPLNENIGLVEGEDD